MRNEWQIQCPGLSLEPWEPWLAEAGFVMLQAFVHVWCAKCAHPVDQSGECVGHGGDGVGCAQPGPEASRVGAQGACTVQ